MKRILFVLWAIEILPLISMEETCGGVIRSANGTISSPSYWSEDVRSELCVWDIEAPPQRRVLLQFIKFHLVSSDANVCIDKLTVHSVRENEIKLHGVYCGNETPKPIMSDENILRITFISKEGSETSGFVAKFDSSSCGGHREATTGKIANPEFPKQFKGDLICSWMISTPPNHRIKLDFEFFDLGNHSEMDDLKIFSKLGESITLKETYIGTKLPEPYISETNDLRIVLRTTSDKALYGFSAHYSTDTCGGVFNAKRGDIHTPFFPTAYGNNQYCTWKIKAETNDLIKLNFKFFDVEYSPDCQKDDVSVFSLSGNKTMIPLGYFCNGQTPTEIIGEGGELFVVLSTDGDVQRNGFYASYDTANCGGYFTLKKYMTVSSPFYPGSYPVNTLCVWNVKSAPKTRITFNFYIKSLDYESDSRYDYLAVYSIHSDGSQNLHGKYYANNTKSSIVSETNSIRIVFSAYSGRQLEGFSGILSKVSNLCDEFGCLENDLGEIKQPASSKWTLEVYHQFLEDRKSRLIFPQNGYERFYQIRRLIYQCNIKKR